MVIPGALKGGEFVGGTLSGKKPPINLHENLFPDRNGSGYGWTGATSYFETPLRGSSA
jgi:hypothetical protein